jgi:hypothetical protein
MLLWKSVLNLDCIMKPKNENKLSEAEIAEVIKLYFESQGWCLYPEVVIPVFPGRPDYIGVKQQLCASIECKTSLSYTVIEQLVRWDLDYESISKSEYRDESKYGIPHLLIAVTGRTKGLYSPLKRKLMEDYRIGHFEVSYEGPTFTKSDQKNGFFDNHGYANIDGHRWRVDERTEARIQPGSRRTAKNIIAHLNDDMRNAVAGTTGVKDNYMTPFKRTMAKATAVLEGCERCHIAHIVEKINANMGGHHYCNDNTARSSIAKFLIEFDIAERDDNIPIFWIKDRKRAKKPSS